MGGKAKKEMNFSCIDEVFESIKKLSKMCCFGKNGKDEEEVEICFFDSFLLLNKKKLLGCFYIIVFQVLLLMIVLLILSLIKI